MLNRLLAWLLAATVALAPLPALAVDDLWDYDADTPANNTDAGGISLAEGQLPGLLNDAIRELISQIKRASADQGSDITSVGGAPAICATGTSAYAKITGTTTITSFGTAAAGCSRWITFTGALTLTYNATSMILDGAANYTTTAGDVIWAVSEGSGNWRVRIFPVSGKTVVPNSNGVHKVWIPVEAMTANASIPPAFSSVAVTSIQFNVLSFDASSIEAAHFTISMPSSWNEGAVTFVPIWSAGSSSGDVVWRLNCTAVSNDDAFPSTFTNGVNSTDTFIVAGDLHRGPESSALTCDGTPAANDLVLFRIIRFATDGGDTLAADANLLGIEVYLTTDAATDAPRRRRNRKPANDNRKSRRRRDYPVRRAA